MLLLTEQLTRVKEPMIWGNALSNVDYCVFVLFFPFFLFALLPRICVPKGRGVLLGRKWSRYIPRCVLCREMVSLYSPLRPLSGSGVISTPRYNVKNVTSDPNDPKCLPPTTEIYCLTRQRNKEEEGTEKLTDNFAIFCFF